ncbi:hypothetical protein SODALDRAFT_208952 [Sodiomyces alkalinus F11]|uniref:C3H1-type domain-containing protein n=1 Tax=Sodiomyces alkalinus (strain CBS 110278 / VKM F-3762 / F11) TaxID=1314773 RepID=A0A3N2PQV7_SODAK|nr:hypothetical protein SODALDRAFT_208952 [Sodiomyces alkalinus F11]ROT36865.1 hypothetical protein SODALDRAFT_208952 [Sodiomyces alkalinus F11]
MASEDQELLAKIGQLAGKINRHKNQQAGIINHHPAHHRDNTYRRGSSSHHPSYRVGRFAPHRNRTLVMNNGGAQTGSPGTAEAVQTSGASTATSWVSKTARHRQLINSSVYERENQNRAKAIETTRKQQLADQNARETAKLSSHFQRHLGGGPAAGAAVAAAVAGPANHAPSIGHHEVEIHGIRFRVAHNGSKLVKVAGDLHSASETPKVATVGGVKFHRSRNGNLYRHGILKAQRQTGVKKVSEPCRTFSSTGTCPKGPGCRYIHDPSKVAVCRDFLQKGICPNGETCDLSHELTLQRTPTCLHYIKGHCANANCPYTHHHVSPSAPVCRAFGIYGYCEAGAGCTERHVAECPDFSNTGKCKTKGCKLLHRERASVLRKNQQEGEAGDDDDDHDHDLSSEDESADSDDVDSDEVDEFLGGNGDGDGSGDADLVAQRDYIAL